MKGKVIHFPTLSSIGFSKCFYPKPRLPTRAPKCETWPQHSRRGGMDGRLYFEGGGTESHPGLGASTLGAGGVLSSPAQWLELPRGPDPLGRGKPGLSRPGAAGHVPTLPAEPHPPTHPESLTLFSASPALTAVIHPWEPRLQIPATTINLLPPQATCVFDLRVPCGFPGSLGAARFHTRGAMRNPPSARLVRPWRELLGMLVEGAPPGSHLVPEGI